MTSLAWERIGALAVLVAIVLAAWLGTRPLAAPPRGPSAVLDAFDVGRALADVEAIAAAPRVPGSAAYDAAREHLAAELRALGLEVERTDHLSVHAGPGGVGIGRAHNLVARLAGTDSTGAVVLAGHLDGVHTTGAASDCGGCAAVVVEVARSLAAGPRLRNDVVFLIEDGEETTRSGALAFVERHRWARDVRVALNMEAMGTSGASLMYVTGPEGGWLVEQALAAMPAPVAYSFVNDLVWYTGTGGSDLDQLLLAAEVGLGLVYVGNVPAYHTMADSLANLDPDTLRHQGASMLALARHLGDLPLDGPLRRPGLVYYNLAGPIVVRYGAPAGMVLAVLAAVAAVGAFAAGLRRGRLKARGIAAGALAFVPLVLGTTLLAGVVWQLVRVVDPRLQVFLIGVSYQRPAYTLAFVVLAAGLVLGGYRLLRRVSAADLGAGALLWWVFLALATAARLPGTGYAFAIPALGGALVLAAAAFGATWSRAARVSATAAGAALAVIVVAPMIDFLGIFSGRAEVLMGMPVIAMFPAAFAAMLAGLLLPAVEAIAGGLGLGHGRGRAGGVLIGLALVGLVAIGVSAGFDASRRKPNMVAYVLDADAGTAHWITGAASVSGQRRSLLDEWTSQYVAGGVEATHYSPWGGEEGVVPAYRSPAPVLDLAPPVAELIEDRVDDAGERRLRLRLASRRDAAVLVARIATTGTVASATVAGVAAEPAVTDEGSTLGVRVHAAAREGIEVVLVMPVAERAPVTVHLEDHAYGLPEVPGFAPAPRPAWMIPSPTFVSDATLVRAVVEVP